MSRSALVSAVCAYNAKVWIAGLAAAVFVPLSIAALVLDLVFGADHALSTRVLVASAQLEARLDVHGDLTDVRVVDARVVDAPYAPGRAVPSAASA